MGPLVVLESLVVVTLSALIFGSASSKIPLDPDSPIELESAWQGFTTDEFCFFAQDTSAGGDETRGPLYATRRMDPKEVLSANDYNASLCSEGNSWLLSAFPPHLPSYEDYLQQFAANATKSGNFDLKRQKRNTRHRVPRNRRVRFYRRVNRHRRRDTPVSSNQQGRSVALSNGPYISPSFTRADRNGQQFRHYKAFSEESRARPGITSGHRRSNANNLAQRRSNWPGRSGSNSVLRKSNEIRNSGSGHSASTVQKSRQSHRRQVFNPDENDGYRSDYFDSDSPSNSLGSYNELANHALYDQQDFNLDDPYSARHYDQAIEYEPQDQNRFDNPDQVFTPNEDNSLIFSQTLGSTGSVGGSFQAEAEGLGDAGERTYSSVNGGSHGSSALASAANANQQAIAHARIDGPAHEHSSQNSDSPQQSAGTGISAAEIENLMHNNGITGFAMATVNARGNKDESSHNIGNVLPGFSNLNPSTSSQDNFNDNTMVDSIIEEVYDPSEGVFIDSGGLDGGAAGDFHRETEFQQVHSGNLPEGGDGNDHGLSGFATYSQQAHGYPPYEPADYPDYYDFEKYNYNPPLYFPEVDYSLLNESFNPSSVDVGGLPSNLNTGIQYPIIEGDVPPHIPNGVESHMIIDDTLPSYFSQKLNTSDHERHELATHETHQAIDENISSGYINNLENHDPISPTEMLLEPVTAASIYSLFDNTDNDEFSSNATDVIEENARAAFNSISEYEKSRQESSNRAVNSQHPFESYRPVFSDFQASSEPSSLEPVTESFSYQRAHDFDLNNYDYRAPTYDSRFEADDDYEPNQIGYRESGYESSFETSSQSSHLYTSSHHYSFQHGQDGKGVGNSIHTVLTQPALNNTHFQDANIGNVRNEAVVTTAKPVQQPYWPPIPSPQPNLVENSPMSNSPQIPVQHFINMPSIRPAHPSGSQGIETMPDMQVLTPGGIGTSRIIQPDNPNLQEIKVVMAGAPEIADSRGSSRRVLLPGEKIPGSLRYTIPQGFRGRIVLSDASAVSSNMHPGTIMHTNANANIVAGGNGQNSGMHLSSSSSASSSGSGYSLSSASSARMIGSGSLSATSSSSSHRGRNGHNQNQNQPVFSYQQSFDTNPRDNSRRGYQNNNNQGMRSDSWSTWTNNQMPRNQGYNGYQQNLRQSTTSRGGSNDCGYFSMRCNIMQSQRRQNEICYPIQIVMPCCC